MSKSLLSFLIVTTFLCAPLLAQETTAGCATIERKLPPLGEEISSEQQAKWLKQIEAIEARLSKLPADRAADVGELIKAGRYAIEFRELYQNKDAAKIDRILDLAESRLNQPVEWSSDGKRQVRGFTSRVDGSYQPLGIVLGEGVSTEDAVRKDSPQSFPLVVWLHGRGDKQTDVHFICERLDKNGEVVMPGAITVHPFGRQCVGYKSAGETDVMESIDFMCRNYAVDENRIVLMGFSMGGAGAWHLGAHYTDRFVAVSPGAGFADVAKYQNLKPENFPPKYEQLLWGVYDVPNYTRNLFNLPVVAYSGELDKQIQAARLMEEAFKAEGRTLPHLIGPGMGHKYHPDTLKELLGKMADAAKAGRTAAPEKLYLQFRHPRYATRRWITADGMLEQYADARVDAKRSSGDQWDILTKNVSRLQLDTNDPNAPKDQVTVDGDKISLAKGTGQGQIIRLARQQDHWQVVNQFPQLRKTPKLSGPIDDAFIDPFLVVLPSGQAAHPEVAKWVRCEMSNFESRWRGLMRGQLRTKLDTEVTDDDIKNFNLILWGDRSSNRLLDRMITSRADALPITWSPTELKCAGKNYDPKSHVAQLIYPNPLNPKHYVVLNSGLTFRPAHDSTNSLQNPHLPDWAVVGIDQAPTDKLPGRIAATGFFNDAWQYDSKLTW